MKSTESMDLYGKRDGRGRGGHVQSEQTFCGSCWFMPQNFLGFMSECEGVWVFVRSAVFEHKASSAEVCSPLINFFLKQHI